MPRIFISYRRDDSRDVTERIHDRLVQVYGEENVFLDVDDHIPPGSPWEQVLTDSLKKSDVLLVIIGREWERLINERAFSKEDYVRFEVEHGLQRSDMLVIPVCVKHTTMPAKLPQSIADLTKRQALQIRPNPDFHQDMDKLIKRLPPPSKRTVNRFAVVAMAVIVIAVALAGKLHFDRNNIQLSADNDTQAQTSLTLDSQAALSLTATQATNTPTATTTPEPTATPSPTATSTPSSTPTATPLPTDTPSPTSTPTVSCRAVTGTFASVWLAVQHDIGCATSSPIRGMIVEENFEHGMMFWREPIDEAQALVLFDDNTWEIFEHAPFEEGSPDYSCVDANTPAQTPPTPKRGFGMMWCNIHEIREGLGNAIDEERGYDGFMQTFNNGYMLQTDTGVSFIFYFSGDWEMR